MRSRALTKAKSKTRVPSFFPASQQPAGTTRKLLQEPDGSVVRRTVLPTGLRVVSESVPGVRAATLGIWAGVGSRDETPASAGAAHFLEHLLFKGTTRRTAMDVAAEVDAVGGQMNAFTSKEFTCFYAKVLGSDLGVAVDVMTDITTQALLRPTDIDAERSVILEEIGLHEDDSSDKAGEAVETAVLSGSKLALPILGTRTSITGMSPRTVRSFYKKHYQPQSLAVTAAGNVDHGHLVKLVRAATDNLDWPWGVAPATLHRGAPAKPTKTQQNSVMIQPWPGEQSAIDMGTIGYPRAHPDRKTLEVLNVILGGGMSSRLFQAVREERGLAYSVYSTHSSFSDAGVWSAAAGCHRNNIADVLHVICNELGRLATQGVSGEELDRAKGHLSGSAVLAAEESSARMVGLGRAEVATGELMGIDELLARIDSVTLPDINRVAAHIFSQPRHVCVVGATDNTKTRATFLKALGMS